VIETIFSWDAMGQLIVEASRSLDYPLMQGTMLIMEVITILANLCADLAYARLGGCRSHDTVAGALAQVARLRGCVAKRRGEARAHHARTHAGIGLTSPHGVPLGSCLRARTYHRN
jgi:hypothetical protein